MPELTSFKVLTLIAKLYTGYAYSLAFIFQSSLVLILAAFATITYIIIRNKSIYSSNTTLSRTHPFQH